MDILWEINSECGTCLISIVVVIKLLLSYCTIVFFFPPTGVDVILFINLRLILNLLYGNFKSKNEKLKIKVG